MLEYGILPFAYSIRMKIDLSCNVLIESASLVTLEKSSI
jgi:hypothetical protein